MDGDLIHVASDDTVAAAIGDGEAQLRAIGVIAGAYFLTPAFHSQVGRRTVVAHFGFPRAITDTYLHPDNFENDPTPDYVMRIGRTLTWKQAILREDMSDIQRTFVNQLRKAGLIDGIAMPLYGPNGRDSYSAFMFERALGPEDEDLVKRVFEITQFQHRKICLLIERDFKTPITISKREGEVLFWMARGKSNADVAIILGISTGTVDTFVRRLYAKLGVNDRIAAVLAGMSRGLLKLS